MENPGSPGGLSRPRPARLFGPSSRVRRGCTLGEPWEPSVGCLTPRPAGLYGPSSRGRGGTLGEPWKPSVGCLARGRRIVWAVLSGRGAAVPLGALVPFWSYFPVQSVLRTCRIGVRVYVGRACFPYKQNWGPSACRPNAFSVHAESGSECM